MGLTKEQETRMYDDTLKTKVIVSQVLVRLEDGDKQLKDCQKRLRDIEMDHSLLKGKLGAFILGLTFVVSLLINGILYVWSNLVVKH